MSSNHELPPVKTEEDLQKLRPIPFSILRNTSSINVTTVNTTLTHNYYGHLNPSQMIEQFSNFVCDNSDVKLPDLKECLEDFMTCTSNDYLEEKGRGPEAAWFTIRMSKPTDEYTTVPRWHRDGRMYNADSPGDVNSKYATALLGNTSRIMKESPLVKVVLEEEEAVELPEYEGDGEAFMVAEYAQRTRIAERLAGQSLVDIPQGSIIKFSWGQLDSPVHSEPDMSTDRIFVSILYGSESELKSMCEMREEEYRH